MEHLIRRLGSLVARHPWPVLATVVVITGVLGTFAADQRQTDAASDASGEAAEAGRVVEERFAGDRTVVQVLVRTPGRDVRNADALAAVTRVQDAVQRSAAADRLVPPDGAGGGDDGGGGPGGVPPVLSFLTPVALATGGEPPADLGDDEVRRLVEEGAAAAPPAIAEQVDALLADDGGTPESGLVLVFLDGEGLDDDEQVALQREVADAVGSVDAPEGVELEPFSFALLLDSDIGGDIARLFGTAFAIILVVLALVYWVRPARGERWSTLRRTLADVGLTLAAVVAAIVWMQGIGVLLGPDHAGLIGAFAPQTQVVPVLVVGLGVDDAIHLTDRYRHELGEGAEPGAGFRHATGTVGVALVLTTVTTAAGFLTNLITPFEALATLGVLAAVGIASALVLTLTLLPAARVLLDRRADRRGRLPRASMAHASGDLFSRAAGATTVLARRVPALSIAVALVLAGLGGWGFTRLDTEFSLTAFVPQDSPGLDTYETIQDEFGGGFGRGTDVLLTGPVGTAEAHNGLVDALEAAADVGAVEAVDGRAAGSSPVSALTTAADADEAVADAAADAGLGDDGRVDPGADVADLYATLLERRPDAAGEVLAAGDGDGFVGRVSLRTREPEDGADQLEAALQEAFAPVTDAGVEVTPTSDAIVQAQLNDEIRRSQLVSMALALAVALALLAGWFGATRRRPELGVLAVATVGLVLAWTFGAMALAGIPLTPVTATLAALSIGIGVDFAIHIVNRFLEARRDQPVDDALLATTSSTGAALTGSALTTLAGFGVLVTSSLVPFRQLGAVTVLAVAFALVASLLVLPSALALVERARGGD